MRTVARVVRCHPRGRIEVIAEGGTHQVLSLALPCSLRPGDWVLLHTGFVAGRLSESQAHQLLREHAAHRQVAS